MAEQRRLLEGEGSAFERELLGSVVDEAPSVHLTRRMQVALGLQASLLPAALGSEGIGAGGAEPGSSLMATGSAGASKGAALGAGGAGSSGLAVGAAVSGALAKPLLVLVATAGIGTAAFFGLSGPGAPAPVTSASVSSASVGLAPQLPTPQLPTPSTAEVLPALDAVAAPERESVESGAETRGAEPPAQTASGARGQLSAAHGAAARAAAGAAASGAAARAAVPETLRAELRSLDAVRKALGQGDAERALRLLERYDAEFPAGTLRREAEVLRGRARRAP